MNTVYRRRDRQSNENGTDVTDDEASKPVRKPDCEAHPLVRSARGSVSLDRGTGTKFHGRSEPIDRNITSLRSNLKWLVRHSTRTGSLVTNPEAGPTHQGTNKPRTNQGS
ncbi:unnamed protein product [Ectocarpus fasciculatus]